MVGFLCVSKLMLAGPTTVQFVMFSGREIAKVCGLLESICTSEIQVNPIRDSSFLQHGTRGSDLPKRIIWPLLSQVTALINEGPQ